MGKKIHITESELRNTIANVVMEALNEIGEKPKGQFMLGRLAHRKGEPVDAKTRMRKDKETYPIFNYADKAQKKAGLGDYYFNDGKHFQGNLENFVDDLDNFGIEGDPRDATYLMPGKERPSNYPNGEPRYDNDGNRVMEPAYNKGTIGQAMHTIFNRGSVDDYMNYPGKVDKEYMLGKDDPAIMPFDITQQKYFGNGSKANPASASKAKRASASKSQAEPAQAGSLEEAVKRTVRRVLKEMTETPFTLNVTFDKDLSSYRGRPYYYCEANGRYYTKIDGEWMICTDNYELEPDCHLEPNVNVVVN